MSDGISWSRLYEQERNETTRLRRERDEARELLRHCENALNYLPEDCLGVERELGGDPDDPEVVSEWWYRDELLHNIRALLERTDR